MSVNEMRAIRRFVAVCLAAKCVFLAIFEKKEELQCGILFAPELELETSKTRQPRLQTGSYLTKANNLRNDQIVK